MIVPLVVLVLVVLIVVRLLLEQALGRFEQNVLMPIVSLLWVPSQRTLLDLHNASHPHFSVSQ